MKGIFPKKRKNFGNNEDKKKDHKKSKITIVIYIVIAIMVVLGCIDIYNKTYYKDTRVEYNMFEEALKNKEIDVVYFETTAEMKYVLFTPESRLMSPEDRIKRAKKQKERFVTDYPNYEDFRKDVLASGALTDFKSSESLLVNFLTLLMYLMPFVWIVLIFKMFSSQMNLSKTKQVTSTTDKDAKFENIIGLDETIEDIKFTLRVLTNPELCKEYNVKPPKGLLLSGPPGTGKTMIAKAIANELKVQLMYVDSSSLIELFAGAGAARVRAIFQEARKKAPCVVFFDELDAIGGKRERGGGGAVDNEYKQVIDAMLQEMDGFNSGNQIFVIGATNLESTLDTALTRSGRFSRKIIVNPPKDSNTRKKMFENYLKGIDLTEVNLDSLANQSTGLTGADIADICNEAKLIAVAKKSEKLTTDILEEALDKLLFKGNRTKNQKKHDIEITAYHESGHAISLMLNNLPISRITIIPNTSGIGGMVVNSDNNSNYYTKEYILARIKSAYAGRVAEELIFGKDKITTGASSDIEVATSLIRSYVEKYGFDEEIGLLDINTMMREGYINNQTTLNKIHKLSQDLYNETRKELEDNLEILKKFAGYLIEHETITGDEAKEIFNELREQSSN